jgi:tRNA A37 threonylcarbamoyladenosine synthetase subunit TsaC/SUA5/YrdC
VSRDTNLAVLKAIVKILDNLLPNVLALGSLEEWIRNLPIEHFLKFFPKPAETHKQNNEITSPETKTIYKNSLYPTKGHLLTSSDLNKIKNILSNGGICVVPSDTGYSIAANPFNELSISRIGLLFPERSRDPISLSFGTIRMIRDYVQLTSEDDMILDSLPNALTLVCSVIDNEQHRRLSNRLRTDATIGVRFPDSIFEHLISNELGHPITTYAIRNGDTIVRDFDEAVQIINTQILRCGMEFDLLFIPKDRKIEYDLHSTVITVQQELIKDRNIMVKVLREGVLDIRDITKLICT